MKCIRCDKTAINDHKCKSYEINIHTGESVLGKKISTCVGCISPESSQSLSGEFRSYEFEILNSIFYYLKISMPSLVYETNSKNSDKTRYDLLISDAKTEKQAKNVVLVEIDEKQHFKPYGIVDGALREEIFRNKYENAKKFILRIRVSEDGKLDDETIGRSCFTKKNAKVSVIDVNKYNSNINHINWYISSVFSSNKPIKHAYINFSDNIGIRHFVVSNPKLNEKQIDELNKKFNNVKLVEQVVNRFNEPISISNKDTNCPNLDNKRIDCIKLRCKEKTTSKTGLCTKHR